MPGPGKILNSSVILLNWTSRSVCVLFPCYSFLFILIEAIKTEQDPGRGKKEIILFLFSSIIEYNDPADWAMFCLHHKCCFHQFLTQKLDRKEYCAAISGNCKNTQILSYWEHHISYLHPCMKYEITYITTHQTSIFVCFRISNINCPS